MAIFPKLIYSFKTILSNFSEGCFEEISKLIFKHIWKYKALRIAQLIFAGGTDLLHFPISKLTTKLQESRPYSTCRKTSM